MCLKFLASLQKSSSARRPPKHFWGTILWLALILIVLAYDRPLYELYCAWLGDIVPLDWLAQFLTNIIVEQWIILGAVLLCLLDRRLRWLFLLDVGLVMLVQANVAELLKRLFGRLRPEEASHLTIFQGPDFAHNYYSLPSGHAAAAFALAAILTSWYPRGRWAFLIGASLVCLARVQLQRHFFSDVLFGAFVGWHVAWALLFARQRWAQAKARQEKNQLDGSQKRLSD